MKRIITVKELEKKIKEALQKKKKVIINCGGGLFLLITPTGAMSFSVRLIIKTGGEIKDTRKTIGYYPKMTLAEARKIANHFIKQQKSQNSIVLEDNDCVTLDDYFLNHWLPIKSRNYKKGSSRPSNLCALYNKTVKPSGLGKFPLNKISAKICCELISSVKQTPLNKHNAVSMVGQCLQRAYVEGIIQTNPIANLLKGSESPFPKPKAIGYKYVFPEKLVQKFLAPLSPTPKIYRYFYLFLVLTGFRFGECRNLMKKWCDFKKGLIIIPSDAEGANKTENDYCKPMTVQIRRLLLNLTSDFINNNEYFFQSKSSCKPICEASFREPIKALTTREVDPHGIRKSMRTWFSSQGIAVNIAELALQHDVRSSLEKVYDKYKYIEEVREALQLWNDYIESQLPEEFLELIRE